MKATNMLTNDMDTLLQQLKKRRLNLGFKQSDMMLRVGVSRQQYQRLESKGNPRLDTLELIAMGLKSQVMLIPKEKLAAVLAIIEKSAIDEPEQEPQGTSQPSLCENPWQNLLGDDS